MNFFSNFSISFSINNVFFFNDILIYSLQNFVEIIKRQRLQKSKNKKRRRFDEQNLTLYFVSKIVDRKRIFYFINDHQLIIENLKYILLIVIIIETNFNNCNF